MNSLRSGIVFRALLAVALFASLVCGQQRPARKPASHTSKPAAGAPAVRVSNDNRPRLVVQVGHASGAETAMFSPDGKFVVTGGKLDGVAIVWDIATGREIRRLSGNTDPRGYQDRRTVGSFSPDDLWVAVASDDSIRIWDVATGKLVRRMVLSGIGFNARAFSFSPDKSKLTVRDSEFERTWETSTGKLLKASKLAAEADDVRTAGGRQLKIVNDDDHHYVQVLDAATGRETARLPATGDFISIAELSPDGSLAVTGGLNDGEMTTVWDTATGKQLRQLAGNPNNIRELHFTPNGLFETGFSDDTVYMREVGTGAATTWQVNETAVKAGQTPDPIKTVVFSPDYKLFVTAQGMEARVWEVATGRQVARLTGHASDINWLDFTPDGGLLLSADEDTTLRLWKTANWQEFAVYEKRAVETDTIAAFSPDGRLVATPRIDGWNRGDILIWELASGRTVSDLKVDRYNQMVGGLDFAPDGKTIITTSSNISSDLGMAIQLWDVKTGRQIRRFLGPKLTVWAAAFSPDGRYFATGGDEREVIVWEAATGRQVKRLIGHGDKIKDVEYSRDGRFILSRSDDSTARIWDVSKGREICRLTSFADGDWVAVSPDGRFDTNNLDSIKGLHWVVPDQPLKALPLEIFMRDFYEPRLVGRLLAGEQLPPAPDISRLNRNQPEVRITDVKPATSATPDIVDVTVEVKSPTLPPDSASTADSDVYNLRLFRDGQLVKYAPEQDGAIKLEGGHAVIRFTDIKLPRRADLKSVQFSAYAFNSDRVKSSTAYRTYDLPAPLPDVKGRAYVISVGVNAYENQSFDLKFAANDARRLQAVVAEKLATSKDYAEVIAVPLISDYTEANGRRTVTAQQATKANFKLVLDLLAGRKVDGAGGSGVPNLDQLRPARPEDVVVLSFAGHGYADESGKFYLVTYDSGAGSKKEVTPDVLSRSVSSDELSLWLRNVDAGEIAMIVDACQSAAAIEGANFKPGPMGSRGLGQLSYDKGMRILTATQADNAALESKDIQQGLLTYALVRDGIELGRADYRPFDNRITLSEWLSYAVERVPDLFGQIRTGAGQSPVPDAADPTRVVMLPDRASQEKGTARLLIQGKPMGSKGAAMSEEQVQQPSLFDFSRQRRDILLMRREKD